MSISRDDLQRNYESRSTPELIHLYLNDELTDLARSVLGETLIARGEQLHVLNDKKAKQSTYIKEEVKKGKQSIFNFRRRSTQLAFLVGLPLYLYLQVGREWNVGLSLMVSVLPLWTVFRIIEHAMNKRKITLLSDAELKNIVNAQAGQLGYELQTIAQDELRRRVSSE